MAVTIRDIAEAVGVSHGVVSRVLNGGSGTIRVSTKTADRIKEVAAERGYRVNAYARNFRTRKTQAIAVLHGVGFPRLRLSDGSQYFARLMDGIVDGAFQHGYTVALCPRLFGPDSEGTIADGRFDGYIWYSTSPSPSTRDIILGCPYPIVLVHSKAAEFENRIPTVICDNSQGIRLALEHLKGLGHRRIGFALNKAYMFGESRLRRDAFLVHGEELGLEVTLIDVQQRVEELEELGLEVGLAGVNQGVEELAVQWSKKLPYTAVIAHNEALAAMIMNSVQAHGIRVPDDLSIIGFDSTDFCELQKPALTSVSQPLIGLGEVAVERLVETMRGDAEVLIETVLPCDLDVRKSTAQASAR
jgi:LacI family transcriptional regulator